MTTKKLQFDIHYSERVCGNALFALNSFEKGEVLFILSGKIFNSPTRLTIEIGKDQHIFDKFGIYMNHSSYPSTEINGKRVIALRKINKGEEITFDYNNSETKCVATFIDFDSGLLVEGKMGKYKNK